MNKQTLKSIWSVFAGFLVVVILSTVTDAIMETVGVFPPAEEQLKYGMHNQGLLVLALTYRTIFTILGGYTTAWLAPTKPQKHVNILGILGTIAGTAGIFAGWNLSDHWYPIALAVLAYPSVWLGGKLKLGFNKN